MAQSGGTARLKWARLQLLNVALQTIGMVAILSAADCQSPGAVSAGAQSPEAAAPAEPRFTSKCAGIACTYDATAATDPAAIVRWTWNFGDGSVVERSAATAKKLFPRPGIFDVNLTVTDAFGGQATFTKPDTITAEPVGMTKIAENSFDCIRDCPSGWYYQEGYPGAAVLLQDPGAPHSAPGIVQQNFTPQLQGGSSPASIGRAITNKQILYAAIWMRISDNFFGHPGNVNKVIHFYTKGGNIAIFILRGAGTGTLAPGFNMQALSAPYTFTEGGQTITGSTEANLVPNVASCTVVRGRWHRYEIVLSNNTPGHPDGRAELWMDGTKCMDYKFITYVGVGQNNKWEEINWSPTYGGGATTIFSSFYTQVDHIYVSGK